MALIKCPECNRKVSDKASICPKCGFYIKDYKPTQEQIDEQNKKSKERKRRVKKYLITTVAIITSLCIICCAIYIGGELWYNYQEEQEEQEYKRKYPLFSRDSYILDADPYGLTNEYNVIGKQISSVLGKCVENEDYTISAEQDYTSYTFPLPFPNDFPIGNDVELVLYTSNGIIYEVEYQFRLDDYKLSTLRDINNTLKKEITNYYDVDPIYSYVDENKEIQITDVKTFLNLMYDNYMSLYQIFWESPKGSVTIFFTNVYTENRERGYISFTNPNIEIEEKDKHNYIDEYITEL